MVPILKDGNRHMRVVILGPPGSGKGTQADLLGEWLPLPHISSGDLFRAHMAQLTPLGVLAREYIDQGNLVPDDITVAMVKERLNEDDCAMGAVLDGFPRNVAQAEALERVLGDMGKELDVVLYLAVSQTVSLDRLAGRWFCPDCGAVYHERNSPEKVKGVCDLCGGVVQQREDDTPEVHQHRIKVYLHETAPLIDHYRGLGLLVEVDANKPAESVAQDVRQVIESLPGWYTSDRATGLK